LVYHSVIIAKQINIIIIFSSGGGGGGGSSGGGSSTSGAVGIHILSLAREAVEVLTLQPSKVEIT
jgi:hypothetical protein